MNEREGRTSWVIRAPCALHHNLQFLRFRRLLSPAEVRCQKRGCGKPREKSSALHVLILIHQHFHPGEGVAKFTPRDLRLVFSGFYYLARTRQRPSLVRSV